MARINIDDQFWLDCMSIVATLGDQDRAIGQALRFFRLAQEKHKVGKLIAEDEFRRGGFSEALIGVFADRVDGGIQAVGAQKHFGWLARRVEAGRKGGQAKPSKPKQNEANESKAKQPEASPSPSPSFSGSSSPKKSCAQPDGFASFWLGYPLKKGKSKTLKLYAKEIAAGATPGEMLKALENYRTDLVANKTEKKFIKHGPTFMAEWRDWLDADAGAAEDFSGAAESGGWIDAEFEKRGAG